MNDYVSCRSSSTKKNMTQTEIKMYAVFFVAVTIFLIKFYGY